MLHGGAVRLASRWAGLPSPGACAPNRAATSALSTTSASASGAPAALSRTPAGTTGAAGSGVPSTAPAGTAAQEAPVRWSAPHGQLHRVPDEVLYALPPPLKAPFPQTAAEKRKKVLLSWAPLAGFVALFGGMYGYKALNPTAGPARTYTEVPDFLMKSMTKGGAGGPGAPSPAPGVVVTPTSVAFPAKPPAAP
jgi:hypothetical protein